MSTVYQKNIETDDMDSVSGIMNHYNDYFPLTGNAGVLSDVLQVDDANKGSVLHKKYSIAQNASAGFLANMPDLISDVSSMTFRDVFYRSNGHILLRLLELYPVAGRVWYNARITNSSTGVISWYGWKCADTGENKELIAVNKYGVDFNVWGTPNEIQYRMSGVTEEVVPAVGTQIIIGTLPSGYRPVIEYVTYFFAGAYKVQVRIHPSGRFGIGYSSRISDGATENIPARTAIYTFGSVRLR